MEERISYLNKIKELETNQAVKDYISYNREIDKINNKNELVKDMVNNKIDTITFKIWSLMKKEKSNKCTYNNSLSYSEVDIAILSVIMTELEKKLTDIKFDNLNLESAIEDINNEETDLLNY
jgi:hypothetical protein